MQPQQGQFIHVGQICVGQAPFVISTVLGSCVAITLYDTINAIGAMNHYLLPFWNSNGLQSPRYGNISIPKMIEMFKEAGGNLRNCEAKIFGGASMGAQLASSMLIGEKNVLVAHEILQDFRIKVVAEDVGGLRGRKVQLNLDNGKVLLSYNSQKDACHAS